MARKNRIGVLVSEFGLHDASGTTIDDTVGRRPRCVLSVAQLSEAERGRLKARGIPFVVFDPIEELPDDVPFGARSPDPALPRSNAASCGTWTDFRVSCGTTSCHLLLSDDNGHIHRAGTGVGPSPC